MRLNDYAAASNGILLQFVGLTASRNYIAKSHLLRRFFVYSFDRRDFFY